MRNYKLLAGALVITAVICLIISCNGGKQKITGIWQLTDMEIHGNKISGNSLGNWLWEFNSQGGYLTDIAGAKEKGKYKLTNNTLTLQPFNIQNRPALTYTILLLDTAQMQLESADSATHSNLHFVKRKVEEVIGDKD